MLLSYLIQAITPQCEDSSRKLINWSTRLAHFSSVCQINDRIYNKKYHSVKYHIELTVAGELLCF